jgi:hypothetical protein
MKKRILLICALAAGFTSTYAQRWESVSQKISPIRKEVDVKYAYRVDLASLRSLLKDAPEAGKGANPVIISLPTTDGRTERFSVYSAPVVEKAMADRYQLGAYSGVGIDSPNKQIRFSISPNDFQSMLFDVNTGKYEFIEPVNKEKDVYGVFFKSNKSHESPFECSTSESESSKKEMKQLLQSKKKLNNTGNFQKNTDQKFRTYRIAISVNGEYTVLAGSVPNAAARINATMTRVNGVYEKDFGIRMIVQDLPQLIFTDPATDPYSDVITNPNGTYEAPGAWNLELQQTLTSTIGVGNNAYDVGHFFGHRGGGGSAGDVGNVCRNPANNNDATSKGAGITSPATPDQPFGDTYDIDYVAHELGHQFGGHHTMSVIHPQSDVLIEPGSGSTIMGYAGITSANVQLHSDAYFHVRNIEEIQAYVNSQNCGIVTPVANTPPTIQQLPGKTIPKGTAFVLTANATDAQNDPMTYTWEEYDISATKFNSVSAARNNGANFRSLPPIVSPSRYFPKFSNVLNGTLSSTQDWETISNVPRTMNFKVTVRDNNPNTAQQQTQSSNMAVQIGNEGPFKVTSTTVYNNLAGAVTWDVVNTNNTPYNVQNVKIDYTTDNGTTWTVISPSTPNDGAEPYSFTALATNSNVKIRVSAIDNIFYAIGNATVSASAGACSSASPTGITVSGITRFSASVNWPVLQGATYSVMYRKIGAATWTTVPVSTNSYSFSGLNEATQYEVQVANVCGSAIGNYSSSTNFTTLSFTPCVITGGNSGDEFISNVTVTPTGMSPISNSSTGSPYTDYTADPTKLITLTQGASGNTINITKQWTTTHYNDGVTAWIDFNRDGVFSDSEIVQTSAPSTITPVSGTFSVPIDAYTAGNTVMRVVLAYENQPNSGCSNQSFGEVEDYPVLIQSQQLATNETVKDKDAIQIYPNPADTFVEVKNLKGKADYKIYSADGRLAQSGQLDNQKINVASLVTGMYIIIISNESKTYNTKLIKK